MPCHNIQTKKSIRSCDYGALRLTKDGTHVRTGSGCACRPGPDILQQYKACVRAVSEELRQPDLPAYCIKATSRVGAVDASSTAARQRVGAFSNANTGAANADALLRSSRWVPLSGAYV